MVMKQSWDASYSVGHKTLDHQHLKLLDICNRLGECLEAGGRDADLLFHELLNELSVYAREHFAAEEAILRQHGYPQLEAQQNEHLEFQSEIVNLCFDASLQKLDKLEAQRFVSRWWSEHILGSDMQYRDFIALPSPA